MPGHCLPVDTQFSRDPPTRPPAAVQRDNALNICHFELIRHPFRPFPASAEDNRNRRIS
jgi:hypothetical protein